MDPQVRCNPAHQANRAQILHDDRVHTRAVGSPHHVRPSVEFTIEDQSIQSEMGLDAPLMEPADGVLQTVNSEILGTGTGVERIYPEVDRVRASADRRVERKLIPSGGQDLGAARVFEHGENHSKHRASRETSPTIPRSRALGAACVRTGAPIAYPSDE